MTDAAHPCLMAPLSDAHVAGLLEQDKGNEAKASSTVRDSFQNFAAGLGLGTDTVASASSYGFNPITRNRVLLEWIHRGNWLGGLAVEVVAEDMTREGIDYVGEIPPQDQARISQAIAELDVWASLCSGVKWGRLYGGAGCVIMIDGQDPSTPLDVTKVGPGQFRGLLPLDRWTVQPVLGQLIDRPGPDLGLPKFYQITATAGLPAWTIHHSRFIRFIGIELPYYQRVYELLWGLSIFERLFDRLVAFDSATQGAAQLVYKSYLRVLKLKGFREAVSAGGPATQGVLNSLKLSNYYQSIEGMSLIDAEDNLEIHGHQAFGGLAEALVHFGQQLSGALQIPLVRLFGQSPAGLNSTGESDLKTYYDGIRNQQMRMLKTGVLKIYQCCAASLGIRLPADFDLSFKSLWQMTEPEKAQVAAQDSATVVAVWQSGLIKAAVALMELKQLSRLTGRFTNISDEDIAAARDAPPEAPGGAVRDHLSAAWDAVWKSEEHPRGYHGRFIEKTGAGGGSSPPNGPEPNPAAPAASGSLPVLAGTGAPPPLPSTPPTNWNIWQYLNPIGSAQAQTVGSIAPLTIIPNDITGAQRLYTGPYTTGPFIPTWQQFSDQVLGIGQGFINEFTQTAVGAVHATNRLSHLKALLERGTPPDEALAIVQAAHADEWDGTVLHPSNITQEQGHPIGHALAMVFGPELLNAGVKASVRGIEGAAALWSMLRGPYITLPSKLGAEFDATQAIGRYIVPKNLVPGTTDYGNYVHEQITEALQQAAPRGVKFTFRIKPGQNGVDVSVSAEDASIVGFQDAEIKPLSDYGIRSFKSNCSGLGYAVEQICGGASASLMAWRADFPLSLPVAMTD